MVQEFKDFINRGNVMDLAVAVVLATEFGIVVQSFGDVVLMQIVVSFVFIALAVFLVVKVYNAMQKDEPAEDEPAGPSEVDLLIDIRDALQRG